MWTSMRHWGVLKKNEDVPGSDAGKNLHINAFRYIL